MHGADFDKRIHILPEHMANETRNNGINTGRIMSKNGIDKHGFMKGEHKMDTRSEPKNLRRNFMDG